MWSFLRSTLCARGSTLLNRALVFANWGAMTDTQGRPQEPKTANDDPEVRLVKSLFTVFKDNRDVLSHLPEIMERCLEKDPLILNPGTETQQQEYRKSVEEELKKKNKQLEASEKQVKDLEEENLKLKSELERKEKKISETVKGREKEMSEVRHESEKSANEMSEKLQQMEEKLSKSEDDLQRMYGEYDKALKKQKSNYDAMLNELAAKDEKIKAYRERLSKMNEDLKNAHTKMDHYKSRLASLSEKRVKQDQRSVEDTLGLNRQSELERDFSAFFDDDRMDACEKMQSIYLNKEEAYLYIFYPRLACIIFETAYEQVKEAKEAATDLFKELIKSMIGSAPLMGQTFSFTRNMGKLPTCTVPIVVNTQGDGSEYSNDVMDGIMLSLKEAADTCNLDCLVNNVLTVAHERWKKWYDEDKSCMFMPAQQLIQGLDKFAQACLRLTWRMVTQVPPMKLEFQSSTFNKAIHENRGYHGSFKKRTKNTQAAQQDQDEEIAYYLWPGLQDGGGRLIRPGEVICKAEEP